MANLSVSVRERGGWVGDETVVAFAGNESFVAGATATATSGNVTVTVP